jgi:hypothetical protein
LPIYLPWSIDPNYRRAVDSSFVPDADERALMELHGLEPEQIAWRRAKISQLGSADYFCQEYPITAAEAFVSSTFDSFIPAPLVIAARREKVEAFGPLILGVVPAWELIAQASLGARVTALRFADSTRWKSSAGSDSSSERKNRPK